MRIRLYLAHNVVNTVECNREDIFQIDKSHAILRFDQGRRPTVVDCELPMSQNYVTSHLTFLVPRGYGKGSIKASRLMV